VCWRLPGGAAAAVDDARPVQHGQPFRP
jgi:hypothetical protein